MIFVTRAVLAEAGKLTLAIRMLHFKLNGTEPGLASRAANRAGWTGFV
jgi:hypothetical protein